MTTLTRRYRFAASHRLHVAALSPSENSRIFGKCNNPFGHGHDYTLEVTASGEVNPATGRLLPIAPLDQLVESEVLQRFAFRNINTDIPEFADLVPTTENLALVIANLLRERWTAYLGDTQARLCRVHIQETGRNGFEVLLPAPERSVSGAPPSERDITTHA